MVFLKKFVSLFSQAESRPKTVSPPEVPSFLPVDTPEILPQDDPADSMLQPDIPEPAAPELPSASMEEKPEIQGGGRYVYARCISVRDSLICFKSVDGLYFGQSRTHFTHAQPDLKIGGYAWFQTGDQERGVFWHKMRNPASLPAESLSFKQHYKVGDRICLPIIGKTETSIKVALGPTLFSFVDRVSLPTGLDYADLNVNDIWQFELREMTDNEEGKLRVLLHPVAKYDDDSSVFPATLEDLRIPQATLDRIRADASRLSALERSMGAPLSQTALKQFIERKYQQQKDENLLLIWQNCFGLIMDIDLGIRDANGVQLKAYVQKNNGRDTFFLPQIAEADSSHEMERYVFIDDWDAVTARLAELALEENWDFASERKEKRHILAQYLRYTFYKAKLDGLLYEEETGALFNTGLVDASYDDIYCYLKRNAKTKDPLKRRWIIGFFACRGKGSEGKLLNRLFGSFPEAPSYIRQDQLENIYFDTSRDLVCDYEHIIRDNLKRLPMDFICSTFDSDARLKKMLHENHPFREIKKYIVGNRSMVGRLETALEHAVETSKKYCRWNYRRAVPIYYPRTNSINLLIPLCLSGDKDTADAALVIEKLKNGNYQGQTILTLDMAYQNARQICRLNNEWLTLETIVESGSPYQEEDEEPENI